MSASGRFQSSAKALSRARRSSAWVSSIPRAFRSIPLARGSKLLMYSSTDKPRARASTAIVSAVSGLIWSSIELIALLSRRTYLSPHGPGSAIPLIGSSPATHNSAHRPDPGVPRAVRDTRRRLSRRSSQPPAKSQSILVRRRRSDSSSA